MFAKKQAGFWTSVKIKIFLLWWKNAACKRNFCHNSSNCEQKQMENNPDQHVSYIETTEAKTILDSHRGHLTKPAFKNQQTLAISVMQ